MQSLYQGNPESSFYLDRALQERAEAQGRAVHLVIVGMEAVGRALGRLALTAFCRARVGYARWNTRRLTVRALSQLDDRMLRDIGILPGDIDRLARELVEVPSGAGPAERTITVSPVPLLRLDLDCPGLKHAA